MQSFLMKRLDDLALSLSRTEGAIALIGLGSVGLETHRMDDYSDIDFFVIVKDGRAESFIKNVSWLTDTYPVAYLFKNTDDGFKLLFEDGIYGECAIFDESRLQDIPFHNARLHWKRPDSNFEIPMVSTYKPHLKELNFAYNEALTNLYVGLLRFKRGEKYSAYLFVQHYALSNVISMLHLTENEQGDKDVFDHSRRIEKRFPLFSELLPKILGGYDHTPQAAKIILDFMSMYYDLNSTMVHKIERLIESIEKKNGI